MFSAYTSLQPPLSTTVVPIQSQISFYSTLNKNERFVDVISEFNRFHRDLHPEMFLNQLDQYFENGYLTDAQHIDLFQRSLSEHSRVWFQSLMFTPWLYHNLKELFQQHFWSAVTQIKVWNESFRPYQYWSSTAIATQAMKWVAKAKYSIPPIDPYDLVGIG